MILGEQPRNAEGLEGEPFVGPAGSVADALAAAGVSIGDVCLTNVDSISCGNRKEETTRPDPGHDTSSGMASPVRGGVGHGRAAGDLVPGRCRFSGVVGEGVSGDRGSRKVIDRGGYKEVTSVFPSSALCASELEERDLQRIQGLGNGFRLIL